MLGKTPLSWDQSFDSNILKQYQNLWRWIVNLNEFQPTTSSPGCNPLFPQEALYTVNLKFGVETTKRSNAQFETNFFGKSDFRFAAVRAQGNLKGMHDVAQINLNLMGEKNANLMQMPQPLEPLPRGPPAAALAVPQKWPAADGAAGGAGGNLDMPRSGSKGNSYKAFQGEVKPATAMVVLHSEYGNCKISQQKIGLN